MDGHRVSRVPRRRSRCDELDMVAMVDALDLRMPRRVRVVDRRHDGETGPKDVLLTLTLEGQLDVVEVHHGIEVAAEGEAVRHGAPPRHQHRVVEAYRVRRHVFDRHRVGVAVGDRHPRGDEPRRGVQANRGDRLDHLDHAGLDQHRRHTDGAVAAHRQAPGHLDEYDPDVRVGPCRRLQDRAAHGAVPARFPHEQPADVVQMLHEVEPFVVHRRARDGGDASGDNPRRHAFGVRVDRGEEPPGPHGQTAAGTRDAR